jgi:hypothetical protein
MKIRIYLIVLLSILGYSSIAQEKKFHIGTPIDLPLKGVNKVLCMKNGHTLLFHFEPERAIIVKTFDSTHKSTGTKEHMTYMLDLATIQTAIFKGLFEVNGEAVLFIEQRNTGRSNLVRLRFNGTTGKLIDEILLGESKSMAKPTRFYVMHNKQEPGYAILFSTDVRQFKQCELLVMYYDEEHSQVREVPLNIDRKKYDYLDVVGAELQPNGVCISLGLSTLKMNGTTSGIGRDAQDNIYDHYFSAHYIPKGGTTSKQMTMDVTTDVFPYYSNYTFNPFANTVNVMLLSYREMIYRLGLDLQPTSLSGNLFLKMDENTLNTEYKWVNNSQASAALKTKADTNKTYVGLPVKLYTNENGLSTMISEAFFRYKNIETYARSNLFESFFGNIAVTQFDDDGKEIWGVLLPRTQYYKSYRHYFNAHELSKRWQEQDLLGDLPPQVYERQLVSQYTVMKNKDLYIIFNDYNSNFNNSVEQPGDTVFNLAQTNAVYYKINRKREVSKHYLLDGEGLKEYKTTFVEGADFDDKRGIYASLIQYTRGETTSLKMAWAELE